MTNEDRDRELYRYPDSSVLRNRLGIRDAELLAQQERLLVQQRITEGVPTGRFDEAHLRDIHRHLFQDVYDWAGEFRQVDIAKGESWFHPHERLSTGMADVHKRLSEMDYLRNLSRDQFSQEAAEYIGDVNRLHPFREGNGRTQLHYLKQLGGQAGYAIDLTRLDRTSWIDASIAANRFDSGPMARCIDQAVIERSYSTERSVERDREGIAEGRERAERSTGMDIDDD